MAFSTPDASSGAYQTIDKIPADVQQNSVNSSDELPSQGLKYSKTRSTVTSLSTVSRSATALQTLGLKTFPSLRREQDVPKIAIQHDRGNALIRCLIHILPFAGAVILLYLNFSWYYVGYNIQTSDFPAFQFAAKLLELLMVASLTTAFLTLMRAHIMSKRGVPFGVAFAGQQIMQLTYLWSPDLWGSMASPAYSIPFKILLFLQIFFFGLLIAVVGPSSAALMIPRPDVWSMGTTSLGLNITRDQLFPTNLTMRSYSNESCAGDILPADDVGNIAGPCPWSHNNSTRASVVFLEPVLDAAMRGTIFDGAFSVGYPSTFHELARSSIDQVAPLYNVTFEGDWRVMTSSTQASSLFVASYYFLRDASIDEGLIDIEDSWDAYSNAECPDMGEGHRWNTSEAVPDLSFRVGSDQIEVKDYFTDDEIQYVREKLAAAQSIQNKTRANQYQDVIFVDVPNNDIHGFMWIRSFASAPGVVNLQPCTLTLGWGKSRLSINKHGVSSQSFAEVPTPERRLITADKAWLKSLNPYLDDFNGTLFTYMASTIGNPYTVSGSVFVSTFATVVLSTMSSARQLMTDGWQANFPNGALSTSEYESWRHSGSAISSPYFAGPSRAASYATQLPLTLSHYGYGYGPNSLTVRISLAVLILYCAVVVVHTLTSLIFGISSSAWDSLSEVVALAMNSRPAPELQNTCVGIMRTHTFEHPVRIAVTAGAVHELEAEERKAGLLGAEEQVHELEAPDERHLELLFPSQEGLAIADVRVNGRYGALKIKSI